MGDPIEFRSLAIGQQFTCCMTNDTSDNPQLWDCIKDAPNIARQIGGVSFRLSGESLVYIKERQKTAIAPEPDHQPAYSVTEIWEQKDAPNPDDFTDIQWGYLHELERKAALLDTIVDLLTLKK